MSRSDRRHGQIRAGRGPEPVGDGPDSQAGRRVLSGTVMVFVAEALMFPTGLLTVAFLTRRLGAEGYGLYSLTVVLITWLEFAVNSLFSRAGLKFIGEASDPRAVGTAVACMHFRTSWLVAGIVWLFAGPVAAALDAPELAWTLRLYALDVPIFSLAMAHRNVLVGLGAYQRRAAASAVRWGSRLLLIVVLVELGLSVNGAILGCIGASVVEVLLVRRRLKLPFRPETSLPMRRFLGYAVPLCAAAVGIMVFGRMDLFMLRFLGGTLMDTGVYGAAQNLGLVPSVLAGAFSALLLPNLARMYRLGETQQAREWVENTLRFVLYGIPVIGAVAGAAPEIVPVLFGPGYSAATPLLVLLLIGAFSVSVISIGIAVLTAAGKPLWVPVVVAPLIPLAVVGHWFAIPRWGPVGAASVTASLALLGGMMSVVAVTRACGAQVRLAAVLRSMGVAAACVGLAWIWPAPGVMLLVKLPTTFAVAILLLCVTGAFGASELASFRKLLAPGREGPA